MHFTYQYLYPRAEGSTESQKELSRPAALARSRFQRPRPNLPARALPRQEKVLISEREDITEERNDLPADNSSSPSHQEDKSITENVRKLFVICLKLP